MAAGSIIFRVYSTCRFLSNQRKRRERSLLMWTVPSLSLSLSSPSFLRLSAGAQTWIMVQCQTHSVLSYSNRLSALYKAMMKHCALSTIPATKCEAVLAVCFQVPSALRRAVKQRWRSYDYTGQHKQRTISLPLEVKYCLDCKAIICETLNTPLTDRSTFWRCHSVIKGLVYEREISAVTFCCSSQPAGVERGQGSLFSLDFHFRAAVHSRGSEW